MPNTYMLSMQMVPHNVPINRQIDSLKLATTITELLFQMDEITDPTNEYIDVHSIVFEQQNGMVK